MECPSFVNFLENFCLKLREIAEETIQIGNSDENGQNLEFTKWISGMIERIKSRFSRITIDIPNSKWMDAIVQLFGIGVLLGYPIHNNSEANQFDANMQVFGDISLDYPLISAIVSDLYNFGPVSLKNKINSAVSLVHQLNQSDRKKISDFVLESVFYSRFLQYYNKLRKKGLGIINTPESIVSFMSQAIDFFLNSKYNIDQGILSTNVFYLDPSSGSLAFPLGVLETAQKKQENKENLKYNNMDFFDNWIKPIFMNAKNKQSKYSFFDLEIVPSILGELRFFSTLKKFGIHIHPDTFNLNLQLHNPLVVKDEQLVIEKAKDANERISVIMTNPPYNVSSTNISPWFNEVFKEYIELDALKREPGKPQIKRISGLSSTQDDYWKFMRYAELMLESGPGIVAFITNNFYLDGMAARGLRKSYRKTFDEIWILNLHGDWKKKGLIEGKNGTKKKDENIFNVNCGIAIIFAIRYRTNQHIENKSKNPWACKVYYYERFGSASSKLNYLNSHEISTIPFTEVGDNLDWEFKPCEKNDEKYFSYPYLCDIFIKSINGIKTGHDYELMGYTKQETEQVVKDLFNKYGNNPPDLPKISWNPKKILKAALSKSLPKIIEWNWRGFDKRWICYDPILMQSHRYSIMQYLLPHQNNVCLIINRQSRGKAINKASSYFITNTVFDNMCNEGASGLHSHAFPLRINLSSDSVDFDNPKPALDFNIRSEFIATLPYWDWKQLTNAQKTEGYEKVFYYIYAILYCPTYRNRYKDYLGREFPRILFARSINIFESMSNLGKRLANIHLLKSSNIKNVSNIKTNMNKLGHKEYKIEKFAWIPDSSGNSGTLCFNSFRDRGTRKPDERSLCIYEIPKEVWQFEIGGIPQLEQWLYARRFDPNNNPKKDHLNRGINKGEALEFMKIINAISETLPLLPEIDSIYRIAIEKGLESTNFNS